MGQIRVSKEAGIATIHIDDVASRNALTPDMARALVDECDSIDADPSIGAVVVHGEHGYFCSGAHRGVLRDAAEDPALERNFDATGAVYSSFRRVGALQPPVIAAVEGGAVGAGVNLLLAADLRIVSSSARIVAGFTRIGIHPGGGHFALLSRLAGPQTTAAVALFGEEISGDEAARLGLAWRAVPSGSTYDAAVTLARNCAADPPLARACASSFRSLALEPPVSWDVALEMERARQMWSLRRGLQAVTS